MARLTSPFLIADVQQSYTAYCNAPHAQRGDFVKPTKAQYKKIHAIKHPKAVAKYGAATESTPVDTAVFSPDVAAIVAAVLTAVGKTPTEAPQAATEAYKARTAPEDRPADAARNQVLWALNTEGLLGEALEASDKPYITQDAGTSVLTATFGPFKS